MPTCYVRLTGLEPARRKTPDPKSGASTNSATGALPFAGAKVRLFSESTKFIWIKVVGRTQLWYLPRAGNPPDLDRRHSLGQCRTP